MTWKTRRERQSEKPDGAENESTPPAQRAKTETATPSESPTVANPFIFDLSGNAFRPVSARSAPAESPKDAPEPDIAALPAPRFQDISDEAALAENTADNLATPPPVDNETPPSVMASIAEDDDPAPPLVQSELSPVMASEESETEESETKTPMLATLADTPQIAPQKTADKESVENLNLPTFTEAEPATELVTETDDPPMTEPTFEPVLEAAAPDFEASVPSFDEPESAVTDVTPTFADAEPMLADEPMPADDAFVEMAVPVLEVARDETPMPTLSDEASPLPDAFAMPEETPEARDAPEVRDVDTPGLIYSHTEDGIPRVAPFIVDIPPPAPIVQPAAPTLTVKFGKFAADFVLSRDVTTLGRPDSTTQTYPDIEIELDDTVSRRHAEVVKRGGEYFVVDVGSANGTKLNGEVLEPYQEVKIGRGDRIHLGERTEIAVQ